MISHSGLVIRAFLALLLLLPTLARGEAPSATQPATSPSPRFVHLDIYLDSAQVPLAAWQFELIAPKGAAIVGVEGGEHPAYREAPFYDPAALYGGRIVVAAFSTDSSLPVGKTRICRLHLRLPPGAPIHPNYTLKLIAAGNPQAQPIDARLSFTEGEAQ